VLDPFPPNVTEINRLLLAWEHVYNHVRPHQSLGGLTPAQFLATFPPRGPSSHMS
jgi:transposase InsO family protein